MKQFFPLAFLAGTILAAPPVDFERDIRPILSANCVFCHGPDEEHRGADLRLDQKDSVFADHDGVTPVVAKDLAKSELWQRIISDDSDEVMPPPKSKKTLTPDQKNLLKAWIEQGAEWSDHWSFVAPEKPKGASLDTFVERRLKKAGHNFAKPADARTLVRRLHLDLNGLPPTPAEVASFVEAHAANPTKAVGKRVDELLARSAFGERMALWWLDAARYGDTSVMHADGPRDMWPWRDWVVKAFNDNKSYDTFSIEQLAGDLLPDATVAQKVASGFNRNHATSDEGGAIAEELRVEYVVDRVRTTANVWMGLTMECAQCHDHKYDPISQAEYYQFYAFFNNHTDPGMQSRKGNQSPIVEIVVQPDAALVDSAREELNAANKKRDEAKGKLGDKKKAWLAKKPEEDAPKAPARPGLKHYFSSHTIQPSHAVEPFGSRVGKIDGKLPAAKKKERPAIVLNGKAPITFDNFPNYDFNGKPFSFAAWLKIPKNANGAVFSDMDVSQKYRGYDFWFQGGSVGTHIVNTWPGNAIKVVSAKPLTPNVWQHVVISYDGKGSSDGVKIYVDGKPVAMKVEQGKLTGSTSSKAPFRIGARSTGATINCQVDDIRIYQRVLATNELAEVSRDAVEVARSQADKRSPEENRLLDEAFYLQDGSYQKTLAAVAKANAKVEKLVDGKVTSMIMADNPAAKMRKTYILDRGAYDAPKKDHTFLPNVPAALPAIDTNTAPNRLTLANWLFEEEHPLTARVAVNQIWQIFYGRGLVETPGDFGMQGAFPSHPELLDWLAVDFRENGWDMKRLVRQIATSRTYLQSSHVASSADPENKLLGRAPRFRLQAELIRDNALSLAGILNPEVGGAGVKPYQPPGLWAEVGLGGNPKFKQDTGDKLYRRAIYTYWKRSAPAPSMQLFDAPTREVCVLKRPRTNTPLQALVTMNDTQFVEAARHLAERMLKQKEPLAFGYELVTAHPAPTETLKVLNQVHETALKTFTAEPARATDLLKVGESPRDEAIDPIKHAAATVVANLLLNLDQTLTRE